MVVSKNSRLARKSNKGTESVPIKGKKAEMIMAPPTNGKIEILLLSEIEVNPKWNTRSNLEESSGGPDEGTGFDGLMASIESKGQDTPIVVKPNKDGAKKPYFLVSGNRRFEAIRRIAEKKGDKAPSIRAMVRAMSDLEAFELNVRENTVRDDLSGADLCFGVGRIVHAYKTENKKFTQQNLADMLGLSQGYIGKLVKISEFAKSELVENWRNSVTKLTVEDMYKVASAAPADQKKLYEQLTRPAEDDGDPSRGKGAWIKTAKKNAAYMGEIIGELVRVEAITLDNEETFFENQIRTLVKFKGDKADGVKNGATEHQVSQIAGAAEKAFVKARDRVEEEESEDEEPAKGKRKSKGEVHAEN